MTSPSLRSRNFAIWTPHSKPSATSRTSSLKRRSDFDFAVEDDGAVADDAHLRVARDLAAGDVAAGDRADLADLEDLADFGAAEHDLAELRREHAAHCLLEVVLDFVDDLIEAQVDCLRCRPDAAPFRRGGC